MKKTTLLIIFIILFNAISLPAYALKNYSNNNSYGSAMVDENYIYYNNRNMKTAAVGKVVVVCGEIVLGYIIDGVVVYATGKSSAQWVSIALSNALGFTKRDPYVRSISVDKNGNIIGSHTSGKF